MNFPSKCPHCGKDIADILPSDTHFFPCEKSPGVSASVYTCMHCKKNLYIMRGYIINRSTKKPEVVQDCILSCYPPPKNSEYPETVKKLSPKAYEIYSDAIAAKAYGLDSLVGAGLRMSLEWIVWDYLLKVQKCEENEIEKTTLANRINKMDVPDLLNICMQLLKMFGNDQIHIRKICDIDANEALKLFDFFVLYIDQILEGKNIIERFENIKSKKITHTI